MKARSAGGLAGGNAIAFPWIASASIIHAHIQARRRAAAQGRRDARGTRPSRRLHPPQPATTMPGWRARGQHRPPAPSMRAADRAALGDMMVALASSSCQAGERRDQQCRAGPAPPRNNLPRRHLSRRRRRCDGGIARGPPTPPPRRPRRCRAQRAAAIEPAESIDAIRVAVGRITGRGFDRPRAGVRSAARRAPGDRGLVPTAAAGREPVARIFTRPRITQPRATYRRARQHRASKSGCENQPAHVREKPSRQTYRPRRPASAPTRALAKIQTDAGTGARHQRRRNLCPGALARPKRQA